jgi:uncharacterized glyoxalase superfamily protein PhnB
MRYRDCVAAIDWLCKALGFEKNAVYMAKATQSPTRSSPLATA